MSRHEDGYNRDPRPSRSDPSAGGEQPAPAARRKRPITPGLIVGLFVIGLGLVLFLEQLGHDTGSLLRWWPLALIVLGAVKVTEPPGRVFGVVLLGLGTGLLPDNLGVIAISSWWFLWPLAVIGAGALLVWRSAQRPALPPEAPDGSFRATAVIGGVDRRIGTQNLVGGEVTAVLGACELDLRRAEIAGDEAVIEIFALLSGIKLRIPDGWEVEVSGTPVLGAFEDRSRPAAGTGAPRLVVRGTIILSGVEIVA